MGKTRQCIFCGQTYEYCNHCKDSNKYPEWRFNFDSEKCHDLYDVVAGYGMGVKTIKDVKDVLDKYDVSDYSIFSKGLQTKLEELVPQKKVEVEAEKKEDKNNFVPRKDKKKYNFERRVNTEE